MHHRQAVTELLEPIEAAIDFRDVALQLGVIGIGASGGVLTRVLGADADINQAENWIGRLLLVGYFGYFAFVWVYTRFGLERTRPVPERVT